VIHAVLGMLRAPGGVLRAAPMQLAVVALALLASGCGPLGHADAGQPRAQTVTLVRAVDGDTIRLAGSGDASRLRLIGQDTPETHQPGRGVECGGPQAAASMAALLGWPSPRPARQRPEPGQP
jgi:micrococcal nuclease